MALKIANGLYWGEDQAGFLPGRYIRDNLRVVIDILEYGDKFPAGKIGFFFLDAEKAFDNINWQFMKKVLEEMSFHIFFYTINNIYSKQNAAIRINNELTQTFLVQRGTSQGCPLSPLLFILTLEILLKNIQRDDSVQGIKIKNHHFKYQAFADIVFFVSDPEKNFPKLIEKLEEFGHFAGFFIYI